MPPGSSGRLRRLAPAFFALAATATAASPAAAQDFSRHGFEITPYAAVYAPTGTLVRDSALVLNAEGNIDGTLGEFTIRTRVGPLIGVRLGRWFSSRLGSELDLGYAPTGTRAEAGARSANQSGSVFLVNGRVLLALGDPDNRLSYHAFAGLGATDLGGDAWKGVVHTTGLGGLLGADARWTFDDGGHALRLELATHFYSVGPLGGSYSNPEVGSALYRNDHRRWFHFLALAVGVSVPLSGG